MPPRDSSRVSVALCASVTLWEAAAPAKLPRTRCLGHDGRRCRARGGWFTHPVRTDAHAYRSGGMDTPGSLSRSPCGSFLIYTAHAHLQHIRAVKVHRVFSCNLPSNRIFTATSISLNFQLRQCDKVTTLKTSVNQTARHQLTFSASGLGRPLTRRSVSPPQRRDGH